MVYDQENRIKDLENKVANLYVELEKALSMPANASTRISQITNIVQSSDMIVHGLPTNSGCDNFTIISMIFMQIGAERFLQDIISVSVHNSPQKQAQQQSQPVADSIQSFSLKVKFKSSQVRDEIINCKRAIGDLPASLLFPQLSGTLHQKVYLNECLPAPIFKLFMDTRKIAKQRGYQRTWVRSGVISVRKQEGAPRITISSAADLTSLP